MIKDNKTNRIIPMLNNKTDFKNLLLITIRLFNLYNNMGKIINVIGREQKKHPSAGLCAHATAGIQSIANKKVNFFIT